MTVVEVSERMTKSEGAGGLNVTSVLTVYNQVFTGGGASSSHHEALSSTFMWVFVISHMFLSVSLFYVSHDRAAVLTERVQFYDLMTRSRWFLCLQK